MAPPIRLELRPLIRRGNLAQPKSSGYVLKTIQREPSTARALIRIHTSATTDTTIGTSSALDTTVCGIRKVLQHQHGKHFTHLTEITWTKNLRLQFPGTFGDAKYVYMIPSSNTTDSSTEEMEQNRLDKLCYCIHFEIITQRKFAFPPPFLPTQNATFLPTHTPNISHSPKHTYP